MIRGPRRCVPRKIRAAVTMLSLAVMVGACAQDGVGPPSETLGMRIGAGFFDGDKFVEFENELGSDIAFTVQVTGRLSQEHMSGSAFGLLASEDADLPGFADDLSLSITVPLGFGSADARSQEGREEIASNLIAVAAGDFDDAYERLAERLVEAGYPDAIVRLGHEFNGAWAPWASRTNEAAFIAAWRHVHQVFRKESADFLFDWTAVRPGWNEWGQAAYPGDEYVDVVGMDIYWRVTDGDELWEDDLWERDYLPTLRDHLAFALAHEKQLSYPEWGLSGADTPRFIEAMYDWMSLLDDSGPGSLLYQSYFNTSGEFSLDAYPLARETFLRLFGQS